MIRAHPIYDSQLRSRLRIALVAATILHIAVLLMVVFRAQEPSRHRPRPPLLVQILPKTVAPKEISSPERKQLLDEQELVSIDSSEIPVPVVAAQSESMMTKDSSAPKVSFFPPSAQPIVENLPLVESITSEQAREVVQELARTALKQLSSTPDVGLEPTFFGKPIALSVPIIPKPISSISQAQRKSSTEDNAAQGITKGTMEAVDLALSTTDSKQSETQNVADNLVNHTIANVKEDRKQLATVSWDEPGKGCTVIEDPVPNTTGIFSDGLTYHIEIQFWVGSTGLVSRTQISRGSGNSRLDAAVLDAARRMSFNCSGETRGRKSYLVRTVGQSDIS